MKETRILLILLLFALSAQAADFALRTGGGLPGSTQFEVVVSGPHLAITRLSLPITSNGMTKTSWSVNLAPIIADKLHNLATSASDFRNGCDSVADGTNASLTVSGKVVAQCTGAAKWPTGPRTVEFLKQLNLQLPKQFQVY